MESTLSEKQFGTMLTRLASWNAIIGKSKMFEEIGRETVADFSGPEGQLHALAKDIQTRNPKVSYAKAYDQALAENPELYKRYRAEREEK